MCAVSCMSSRTTHRLRAQVRPGTAPRAGRYVVVPGEISCPRCDAPAPARARACAGCGFRFLEDERPAPHPSRGGAVALAVGALAAVGVVAAVLVRGGGHETSQGVRSGPAPEVLSTHPLSTRAAERRLEARFTSLRDDDSAGVRCGQRHPEPAHAVRRCRIRYPNGAQRTVVLMMNARGRELLIGP